MADPIVWGLLPKAQDDPQTIAEAIDAAISAHNDDPDSHLGSTRSLEAHKTNDVVDHPVGSVLADKTTMSELDFSTQFENLSVFNIVHTPTAIFPGFLVQGTSTGYSNREEVYIDGENSGFILDFSKDFLFQFSAYIDTYQHGSFRAEISNDALNSSERCLGLEIIDSVAKFYFADFAGANKTYLSFPTYEDALQYVIRMQYVASEQKCHFYINGEELGTLDLPTGMTSDVLYISFWHYNVSGSSAGARIYNTYYSLQPNQ